MAKRSIALLILTAAAWVNVAGEMAQGQDKKSADWIDVLRKDPRLKETITFSFKGTTDIAEAFALLKNKTGLSFTLADQPKEGKAVFSGASGGGPAWLFMRVIANTYFHEARWEKVDDGYELHGKPKTVQRLTLEEEAAVKKNADAEAAAKMLLRSDVKLQAKMTVTEADAKLTDLLERLNKCTGLRLTLADNLKKHEPMIGSVQWKDSPAYLFMDLIAERGLDGGRWLKTDDGYRLEGVVRPARVVLLAGKPLAHWMKELKDPDPLVREEALVVVAGKGDATREAVPLLAELLKDKSPQIRIKAAIALARFEDHAKVAVPVLLAEYKGGSPTLRQQILPALGPVASQEDLLFLLLRESVNADEKTRVLASNAITNAGLARMDPLVKALDHADAAMRRQAADYLGFMSSAATEAVPALTKRLKDDDWDTRFRSANALWRIEKSSRIVGVMVEASAKKDKATQRAAWDVLVEMKPPPKEALAAYRDALKESELYTKLKAANAVWHITRKAEDVVPAFREALEDKQLSTNVTLPLILTAVEQMGPEAKALRLPLLEILNREKDDRVIRTLPPALARLGPESIPALLELAGGLKKTKGRDFEMERSRAACRAIGLMGKDGLKPLITFLEHPDVQVRIDAYDALQLLGPDSKEALPALQRALKHKEAVERTRAVKALACIGPDSKEALTLLQEVARNDKEPTNRRMALGALPRLQQANADIRPLLDDALKDADPLVRLMAADWLWHLDPKDARPLKIVVSSLTDPSSAYHAYQMLGRRRDAAADVLPALTELLGHKNHTYRLWAINALDRWGVDSKGHKQKLVAALDDPEGLVRLAAARALRKLGVAEKAAINCLMKSLAARDKFGLGYATALAEFGPAAKEAASVIEREMPLEQGYWRMQWIEALIAIDPAQMPKWRESLEESVLKNWSGTSVTHLAKHYPNETKYREFLVEQLQSSESRTRIQAALSLEKLEPKKHKIVPVLIEALQGPPAVDARIAAAAALRTVGPAALEAVPALRVALRDPDSRVRNAANEALWNIDPKSAMPCVFQGY